MDFNYRISLQFFTQINILVTQKDFYKQYFNY